MPPTTPTQPAPSPPTTTPPTTTPSTTAASVEPTSTAPSTTAVTTDPATSDRAPATPSAPAHPSRVPRRAGFPSALVASRWAGDLASPGVSSAVYRFTTVGGLVSATAAWSGDPVLQVVVACGDGSSRVTGSSGLAVSVVAAPGPCTATIEKPPGDGGAVAYTVTARYRHERRS